MYQEDILAASNPGPIHHSNKFGPYGPLSHRHEAAAVLLLSLLLNVQSLIVTDYHSNEGRNYLLMFIRKVMHSSDACDNLQPGPLRNLRSATFRHSDTRFGEDFKWLSLLAAVPSVQKLEGEVMSGFDRLSPYLYPEKTSGVTSLILTKSAASIGELTALLSALRDLRVFHYMPGGAVVGYDDYLPNQLCISLQTYAGRSLEILKLGAEEGCVVTENMFIRYLQGFQKLKRFEIEASILLSGWTADTPMPVADILPASLEVLGLGVFKDSYEVASVNVQAVITDTKDRRPKKDMQTLDALLRGVEPKRLALKNFEVITRMWYEISCIKDKAYLVLKFIHMR